MKNLFRFTILASLLLFFTNVSAHRKCKFCDIVVESIQQSPSTFNRTLLESNICSNVPDEYLEKCEKRITKVIDGVLNALENGTSPSDVCGNVFSCNKDRKHEKHHSKHRNNFNRNDTELLNCWMCEAAVHLDKLNNHKNMTEIFAEAEYLCQLFNNPSDCEILMKSVITTLFGNGNGNISNVCGELQYCRPPPREHEQSHHRKHKPSSAFDLIGEKSPSDCDVCQSASSLARINNGTAAEVITKFEDFCEHYQIDCSSGMKSAVKAINKVKDGKWKTCKKVCKKERKAHHDQAEQKPESDHFIS